MRSEEQSWRVWRAPSKTNKNEMNNGKLDENYSLAQSERSLSRARQGTGAKLKKSGGGRAYIHIDTLKARK